MFKNLIFVENWTNFEVLTIFFLSSFINETQNYWYGLLLIPIWIINHYGKKVDHD